MVEHRGRRLLVSPVYTETCPGPITEASRLVLVTTRSMDAAFATLQLFTRPSASMPWKCVSAAEPAVVVKLALAGPDAQKAWLGCAGGPCPPMSAGLLSRGGGCTLAEPIRDLLDDLARMPNDRNHDRMLVRLRLFECRELAVEQ
jgi:hypothetical protein